jgi:hypothetical protein
LGLAPRYPTIYEGIPAVAADGETPQGLGNRQN